MNYEAVVINLGGTLVNSRQQISRRNLDVLKQAARSGVHVVLSSGRPAPGMRREERELELPKYGGYLICYNGAEIIECRPKGLLRRETMPVDYYHTICHIARKYNVAALSFSHTGVITEKPDDEYVIREADSDRIGIERVDRLDMAAASYPVVKFMLVGDPKALKAPYSELNEKMGSELNIVFSEPYFMEVTARGAAEKIPALELLLEHIGVDRSRLMVIGDGYNDIQMMQYGGFSVAMANAVDEVQQFADFITDTNDNDGVAKAVEKYILHG